MSRTNHHRRYKRWNIIEPYFDWIPRGSRFGEIEYHNGGMELYDLRFYAGSRRQPQRVHRVLDFYGLHPWRIHYGRDGVAKSYADIREGQFRSASRRYVDEARAVWNAGGDVDEVREPDRRPYRITYDLW